jgi:hypothetical protein
MPDENKFEPIVIKPTVKIYISMIVVFIILTVVGYGIVLISVNKIITILMLITIGIALIIGFFSNFVIITLYEERIEFTSLFYKVGKLYSQLRQINTESAGGPSHRYMRTRFVSQGEKNYDLHIERYSNKDLSTLLKTIISKNPQIKLDESSKGYIIN